MKSALVSLDELCQMDRQHVRPSDPDAAQLPFVGVEHVAADTGAVNLDSDSRVGDQKSATFRFDGRHVLYGKLRPYLNKVATPDFAGRCSTELIPLLPQDGVDRDFLAYLLRRRETVDFAMASVTGSRMPRTDMNFLLSMRVPLPPLDEQRRIVAFLNRAARIEQLRSRAAARLREFVPAMFVSSFGDPARNPMGWQKVRVGEVCEVQGGLQVSKRRAAHPLEAPYLRVANVLRDELVLDEIKRIRLTERELARVRLKRDDLLVVEGHGNAAEIGRVAVWDGSIDNCVHQNHLIRARPDTSSILPSFVCAYLNSRSGRQHLLREGKTTSGLNTITTSDVKSCPIFAPPLELQQAFVRTVARAQRLASRAECAVGSATSLSSSMMSKLLSPRETPANGYGTPVETRSSGT